jgi:hypothetical protein
MPVFCSALTVPPCTSAIDPDQIASNTLRRTNDLQSEASVQPPIAMHSLSVAPRSNSGKTMIGEPEPDKGW